MDACMAEVPISKIWASMEWWCQGPGQGHVCGSSRIQDMSVRVAATASGSRLQTQVEEWQCWNWGMGMLRAVVVPVSGVWSRIEL